MTERVNITLPGDLLAVLDEAAAREHTSRSGLIRAAVLERIAATLPAGSPASAVEEPGAVYASVETHRAHHAPARERVCELLRAFFAARPDVVVGYLFGSVASETTGPMSDIDVAVLLAWDTDELEAFDIELDLRARLPEALGAPRVDVVVLNRAPVRLAWEAVSEGVVVWGKDSPERLDFELAAFDRQQDFGPVLESFGEGVLERIGDGRFGR